MGAESLSRGVDLFFAQEFCFFKQEHGPTSGSEQAKTDVLLTRFWARCAAQHPVPFGGGVGRDSVNDP